MGALDPHSLPVPRLSQILWAFHIFVRYILSRGQIRLAITSIRIQRLHVISVRALINIDKGLGTIGTLIGPRGCRLYTFLAKVLDQPWTKILLDCRTVLLVHTNSQVVSTPQHMLENNRTGKKHSQRPRSSRAKMRPCIMDVCRNQWSSKNDY